MRDVLKDLAKSHTELSIATGYWDLKAIQIMLDELQPLHKIRLLIGREPIIPRHQLYVPEIDFPESDFAFDLTQVAPTSELRNAANKIIDWLHQGKLEVRIYKKSFLHAKTYIFGNFESDNAVGIIGSSNFTGAGLTQNTELNSLEPDHRVVAFKPRNASQETGHLSWFEGMWTDDETENWDEKFGSILEISPVGNKFYSPFEMYMKTLYNLYKEELIDDEFASEINSQGKTLFTFQQKNAQALLRRLNRYRVAMLSDSVGLGKTITAIQVIKKYTEDTEGRKRVEIICPKSIVQQWEKELAAEGIYGHSPITLQNTREIEEKKELDSIASVSLFVIDESHNLRQTNGVRFQQLLNWIRSNPKAHVLLLTATPINNNLSDLTNQILLGTGGETEVMKMTVAEDDKQTTQVTFHQAVENLQKKINQDLKRNGQIDYEHIRNVMTPIIRTFVVRRTRQGIESEYGALLIDGEERKFPRVSPEVVEYTFSHDHTEKIRSFKSQLFDLDKIYLLDPEDIVNNTKDLLHPISQLERIPAAFEGGEPQLDSPMFYIFQLILLLGFMPYRWMMYQSKFHGKTRNQIRELRLGSEESKKLLQQIGIFGILRTVFLKRMESSVSALRTSLNTYSTKLDIFEKGVKEGKIVSVNDLMSLEASLDDEDFEIDPSLLAEATLDEVDGKRYALDALLLDIKREKELVALIDKQLEVIGQDDSKIREFGKTLDLLRLKDPDRKILVFSYFSDTVDFLKENIGRYSSSLKEESTAFVTSKNRSDSENLASRFSPKSKRYVLKPDEQEISTLFSTDVLSEGQNLQDAGVLINYDLHWNPVRMIQRNGRVNRLGSLFSEVFVHNMRPESKLDAYLKLIQRLQGKIDIIRNTIGTDTPVLDEPENPIEYTDSINDIYSADFQKRVEALEKAEKASDFLLSEDEFVMDLKKFNTDPNFSIQYKENIYAIPRGKLGLMPDQGNETGLKRPPIMSLIELRDEANVSLGYQFVETDSSLKSIRAMGQLNALHRLRASASSNQRVLDDVDIDRVSLKALVESKTLVYTANEEVGALVGQENDVLRIMHSLEYPEDDINIVRDSFKTSDLFYKRELSQLKTRVMRLKNKGENYQKELRDLVSKAKQASSHKREETKARPVKAELSLAYVDWKLNG
jgi:ERCC4-related helicase